MFRVAVLHGIQMDVIDMAREIGLIANLMFPKTLLPKRTLIFLHPTIAYHFANVQSRTTSLRDERLDDSPTSRKIGVTIGKRPNAM